VSVKPDCGIKDKVEGVKCRKKNNHLPRHKLVLDLVGDPERCEQAYDTVVLLAAMQTTAGDCEYEPDYKKPL